MRNRNNVNHKLLALSNKFKLQTVGIIIWSQESIIQNKGTDGKLQTVGNQ